MALVLLEGGSLPARLDRRLSESSDVSEHELQAVLSSWVFSKKGPPPQKKKKEEEVIMVGVLLAFFKRNPK